MFSEVSLAKNLLFLFLEFLYFLSISTEILFLLILRFGVVNDFTTSSLPQIGQLINL